MFEIDNLLDFNSASAETLYVDAGKIKKNYEMLLRDLGKISNEDNEDFVKIYIGMSGGQIRPVIASTKLLRDFVNSQYMIASTISDNAVKIFTGEAENE